MSSASIAARSNGSMTGRIFLSRVAMGGPFGSGAWAGPPGPWHAIVCDASATVNWSYPRMNEIAVDNSTAVTS
jgi:hypothetical protein